MQANMKFALFGNTYQEHKSAHIANLLEILRRKEAQICISSEFYYFLKRNSITSFQGANGIVSINFSISLPESETDNRRD